MIRKHTLLTICFILFVVSAFGLPSCAQSPNQTPVIRDIIYAREVPTSFETLLKCTVYEKVDGPLQYKWSSDNGTIRGDGNSVTWAAPSVPGTYNIGVRVTGVNGAEATRMVSVKVVPFQNTIIDINPAISLQVPVWGNDVVGGKLLILSPAIVEVECRSPLDVFGKNTYKWSCNGGKIQGDGVKDGTASRIGWMSPGTMGRYTVSVTISDALGNEHAACAYINVTNAGCGCNSSTEICGE
ncbi:MAG: hypothetical protein EHM12_00505 [Dehalococcoidia bacterium]|nr:MAG: hypothetical protein EHM12_00505 [Dehalococcoidia bacterium]